MSFENGCSGSRSKPDPHLFLLSRLQLLSNMLGHGERLLSQGSVGELLGAEKMFITAQQDLMSPLRTSQINSSILPTVGILLSIRNDRNVTVS